MLMQLCYNICKHLKPNAGKLNFLFQNKGAAKGRYTLIQWRIYIVKFWTRAPPPGVQILSISCSFWENLAKSYVGGPPWRVGAPSSRKSWIRHCNLSKYFADGSLKVSKTLFRQFWNTLHQREKASKKKNSHVQQATGSLAIIREYLFRLIFVVSVPQILHFQGVKLTL